MQFINYSMLDEPQKLNVSYLSRLSRFTSFAVLMIALTGCSLEDQAKESAENAVRQQLRDPDSAVFENVRLVYGANTPAGHEMYTCGTINAKNGFGGMVGRTRFVVTGWRSSVAGHDGYSTGLAIIDNEANMEPYFEREFWSHCN